MIPAAALVIVLMVLASLLCQYFLFRALEEYHRLANMQALRIKIVEERAKKLERR